MIKAIVLICSLILMTSSANAEDTKPAAVDELAKAYQREILFLSTYKAELKQKIAGIQKELGGKVQEAKKDLEGLESQWLGLQTSNELKMQKLSTMELDFESRKETRDLLDTTLQQAQLSSKKALDKNESDEMPLLENVERVFATAFAVLNTSNQVTESKGRFFSENGEENQGTLLAYGSVARFAKKDGKLAALYPTGGGEFRVWQWLDQKAGDLTAQSTPSSLGLFLFDNPNKEFAAKQEKTLWHTMEAGGLIGWIIVAMGLFAALISVLRFLLLQRASGLSDTSLERIIQLVRSGDIDKAQGELLENNSSIARVLSKTMGFLRTQPEKVEDAIMESIIKESQLVDRFGVAILVIASVAPLMGLLGTVTGMISTFDIITLYGTGNPKLLSGGISEALVTTMFGLIVAIPALLVGQFLSAKTEGIKSDMEKWALATCNAYKKPESK